MIEDYFKNISVFYLIHDVLTSAASVNSFCKIFRWNEIPQCGEARKVLSAFYKGYLAMSVTISIDDCMLCDGSQKLDNIKVVPISKGPV